MWVWGATKIRPLLCSVCSLFTHLHITMAENTVTVSVVKKIWSVGCLSHFFQKLAVIQFCRQKTWKKGCSFAHWNHFKIKTADPNMGVSFCMDIHIVCYRAKYQIQWVNISTINCHVDADFWWINCYFNWLKWHSIHCISGVKYKFTGAVVNQRKTWSIDWSEGWGGRVNSFLHKQHFLLLNL